MIGGQPSLGGFHHVVGEGRRRNKEDDAHKEADDGGSVFFPVALIVLAGKYTGKSEQLVGELRGSDRSAAYLDVHALADRLHGGNSGCPF